MCGKLLLGLHVGKLDRGQEQMTRCGALVNIVAHSMGRLELDRAQGVVYSDKVARDVTATAAP